jgi:hypothetical protein
LVFSRETSITPEVLQTKGFLPVLAIGLCMGV